MGKALRHTCDKPEQIRACLECKMVQCPGWCVRMGEKGVKRPRGSKLDKDGIGRKLLEAGMTDAQIAQAVGMHKQAVFEWRKRNGLPRGKSYLEKQKGA